MMPDDEELVECLRRKEHKGKYTIGGGTIDANGNGTSWGGERVMELVNPDGPEAATRIEQLHKEVERLRGLVEESLFHLRLDARAEAYHHRALAELNTRARSGEHQSPTEESR